MSIIMIIDGEGVSYHNRQIIVLLRIGMTEGEIQTRIFLFQMSIPGKHHEEVGDREQENEEMPAQPCAESSAIRIKPEIEMALAFLYSLQFRHRLPNCASHLASSSQQSGNPHAG